MPQFPSGQQQLAHGVAAGQAVEGRVQPVEPDPLAHQPVDRQTALAVEGDEARQVALGHAAADVAALDGPFLGHEADVLEGEIVVGVGQPGADRGAAAPGHPVGEIHGLDRARHLEGEVDPALGRGAHLLDAVRIAGAERRAGAELAGERQLVVVQIDGDEAACADQLRGEQRVQPDAAEADHRDGGARLHPGGVDHRADAGQHGAAEQRGLLERQRGVDPDRRVARDHGALGEGRDPDMMVDRRAVEVQPPRAREQRPLAVGDGARLAQRRPPGAARQAMAAARHEHQDDVVALGEIAHARAERLDHACGFVTQHHRQRPRPVAVDHRQIRMAEPGGLDPHQDLAGARAVELDLLDGQRTTVGIRRRRADPLQNGCPDPHGTPPAPLRSFLRAS